MTGWTKESLVPLLEAIFFTSSKPITLKELYEIIPDAPRGLLKEALSAFRDYCNGPGRGVELVEVANGFRLQTRQQYKKWVIRSNKKAPNRLSRAALETLAIIAYKQPITRAEIEAIRGVDASGTLRQLLSKNLIRITGRKDVPGRPLLYGTTKYFLELFQLKDLKALPTIREIEPLASEQQELFKKIQNQV